MSNKGEQLKKHCMFQLWLSKEVPFFGYADGYMVEDTDLISWEEALELWEKYKPQVMKQLNDGQNVEMCIWTGCEDNTSYGNDAFHVTINTVVKNGKFIEVVEKVIDPSKVIMGVPANV